MLPAALAVITGAISVVLLSQALRTLPAGTGYAIWTGIGATGAVILGMALFNEPRDLPRAVPLALLGPDGPTGGFFDEEGTLPW